MSGHSKNKPKSRTSRDLPPRVRRKHGAFYYVVRHKWQFLCRESEGESAMFAALARVTNPSATTCREMIESYLSHGSADLAPQTLEGYRRKKKALLTVFGDLAPQDVKPGHVAQFLELRKNDGKAVAGNREMALLSSAFSYAMRNGFCDRNPCYGVRRNKEKPRSRYIEDKELQAAMDKSPPEFADVLLFAYMTGWRQADILALEKSQITQKGLELTERKTGKQLVMSWTPALREIVTRACKRSESDKVFVNTLGYGWTSWAVQSQMRRLSVDWTFHDLRAKAESDHKSGLGLLSLYRRARKVSPVR